MFGLSWGQIAIIVLVGVFVLGPERIPTTVTWVMTTLRKVRTMAAGAQAELRREIGPELDELRRQVADLQSLKETQELRDLRDLHPKRLIGKNILGDEFSGGITGFLGLGSTPAAGTAPTGPGSVTEKPVGTNGSTASAAGQTADGASSTPLTSSPPMTDAPPAPPHLPPSMTKLAAPKVVGVTGGSALPAAGARPLAAGERPPFDPDGT